MVLYSAEGLTDEFVNGVPDRPAVFVLWPREGEPHLARTNLLRRRLNRLARMGAMRQTVSRVECWLTGSTLEAHARMYELARQYFPANYMEVLRLRLPAYLKLFLTNAYPRTAVTTSLQRPSLQQDDGFLTGPFRSRAAAERFEAASLDLFQVRRCQEDLAPSPHHPGCMYGEMSMCLRPCQEVVGALEYRHEVRRLTEFLSSDGRSLIEPALAARDQFSAAMDFEEAAKQHARAERIEQVVKLRDEIARPLDQLHGAAVAPSVQPHAVELFFMRGGHWQGGRRVDFDLVDGKPVSLDRKLRETVMAVGDEACTTRERQEYLAILARWVYSTWRDGEFLLFDSFEQPPYRKLVHAISRVYRSVV